jgi:hypothetical protein
VGIYLVSEIYRPNGIARAEPRSQSYDFGIYNYNASVVVGYLPRAFFKVEENIFVLKTRQAIRGFVIFFQRWRVAIAGLAPENATGNGPRVKVCSCF